MEERRLDRRKSDEHVATVVGIVRENTVQISKLQEQLQEHISSEEGEIKAIKESIQPVLDVQHDIAAVGRFGVWLKNLIVWLTVVGGFFAAVWQAISHFGDKN